MALMLSSACSQPTTLILVRHGETEGNVQQVWHGAMDAPLTKRGRKQVAATARRVAALLERAPLSAFYVSPLARAQSTAEAIAAATGVTPVIDADLREFDLGEWEGRTFRDLREREDLWGRWSRDPWFAPPQGESPRSFNQRAVDAMQRLAVRHCGGNVLVVTHSGVISAVLASWLGDGAEDWRRWEPHNCAITLLEWDGERWDAECVNDVAHLPADTVVSRNQVY
jgi:probable phosphoglycerate mutase